MTNTSHHGKTVVGTRVIFVVGHVVLYIFTALYEAPLLERVGAQADGFRLASVHPTKGVLGWPPERSVELVDLPPLLGVLGG